MNLDQFISVFSRSLVRGFRSTIDAVEFLESENMTRQEAEQACRAHVAQLVEAQDGYPDQQLRLERNLSDRQNQYRSTNP
jgi:hypothetical protein